jgi:hypothetical protein
MKLAVVIGLSLRNSIVMSPMLVWSRTLVPPTYKGSVIDVGDVVAEVTGVGVAVKVVGAGVGVGVGDTFAG